MIFGLAGKDPYLGRSACIYGLGILAIVLLQMIAAASICGFFLRHRKHEPIWAALVAPALGGIGLAVGLAFMIANYYTLTGSALPKLTYLPWLLPIAAAIGALMGVEASRGSGRTFGKRPRAHLADHTLRLRQQAVRRGSRLWPGRARAH